jgi:nitroreductase
VEVPDDVIKKSLERAILAPNSSNMQLWEFYWIKSDELKQALVPLCFGQSAAKTAKHIMVFVTRRDLWPQRAAWNLSKIKEGIGDQEPTILQKRGLDYYGKLMPLVYRRDLFGLSSLLRKTICFAMGLIKPFMRMGGNADQRVMVHKSCALAAQTFMLSITAEGYASCPMEGFDAVRVKKQLNLPRGAEINMIIGIGKGTEAGIYNPRIRVAYDDVVFIK